MGTSGGNSERHAWAIVEDREMIPEIQHVEDSFDGSERWQRLTDDPDIRAADKSRGQKGTGPFSSPIFLAHR
jgi:hypothetical protein